MVEVVEAATMAEVVRAALVEVVRVGMLAELLAPLILAVAAAQRTHRVDRVVLVAAVL